MVKTEFYFPSVSGLADIHAAKYLPEGEVKAVVQIAHGMAEHLERYEKFAQFLTDNGVALYINDHLGHGKSVKNDDELGYFGASDGWKNFIEDCHKLTEIAKKENEGKPYVFFGHSMGSFVARAYAFKYSEDIDAAVFCGTSGANPLASVGKVLAGLIAKVKGDHHRSKLIDKMSFGAYNNKTEKRTAFDWLSVDKKNIDDYLADPYCGFLFTATGSKDLISLLSFVSDKSWYEGFNKSLPVLLIAGSEDPVGQYGKGVREVADKLKSAGVKSVDMKLYDGYRHEILNEPDLFPEVAGDVLSFIKKTCNI